MREAMINELLNKSKQIGIRLNKFELEPWSNDEIKAALDRFNQPDAKALLGAD